MLAWLLIYILFHYITANKTVGNEQKSIISSFIPGLDSWNQVNAQNAGHLAAGVPILHTITQAIPSLRTLPGMNVPSGAQPVTPNRNLNNAIEQFTAPIVRFATGGQPVASDVQQFIQSIPNFIVNIPGFGDIDASTVDPKLIDYVLKGGQLPGLTKETMDGVIQNYMKKVYDAAIAALNNDLQKGQEKFLLPLDKLPNDMVNNVMSGKPLPGLTETETQAIMNYYAKSVTKVPASKPGEKKKETTNSGGLDITELWKMLPANYNMSKVPQEIFESVMNGEFPDLKNLPDDLLNHFKLNMDKVATMLTKFLPPNSTINEILSKIPKFEKPVLTTFSPYDINADKIKEEEAAAKAAKMRIYTAIALGVTGLITLFVIGIFIIILKKRRANKTQLQQTAAQLTPGPPLANSTMIINN